MLSQLKAGPRVAGAKQTKRALGDGRALQVFLARDADPRVVQPLESLCVEKRVPLEQGFSMAELGAACGIAVGCAVAARIR